MAQVQIATRIACRRPATTRKIEKPRREFALLVIDWDEYRASAKLATKVVAVCVAIAFAGSVLAKPIYDLKCQAGMDIIPGVHAPDVFQGLE